jgi:hypothetical protein
MAAMTEACPHCAVRLDYEADGEVFSRAVGVEIPRLYDGVLFWRCPDCGECWHRYPTGDFRRASADRYAEAHGLSFMDMVPMPVSEVGPGQFRRSAIEVRDA